MKRFDGVVFVLVTEKDSPAAAGNSTAAGLGVGEAGLEEEEAKSPRVAFSSAWSSQRSGGLPGSPRRRGARELGVAPASSSKEARERQRG
jgi:hypothetical protein